MSIVLFVVSVILASIAIQVIRGIYMKIIGANAMFINGGKQFVITIILTFFIYFSLTGGSL